MPKAFASSGADRELISADIHNAVCCECVDEGTVDGPYGPKHRCFWVFQVEERYPDDDSQPEWARGKRKEVRAYFNLTLGSPQKPSNLRKWVEKWRGRPFTEEEVAAGFDPDLCVGVPCRLDVVHYKDKKGNDRDGIDGILAPGKTTIEMEDYMTIAERQAKRAEREGQESSNGGGRPATQQRPQESTSSPQIPF